MQVGKKDLMWGYIAQFLRWGNGLILLPVILRLIPSEQLAFWYLFASISSMVLLFDFGFSSTIKRNITYVFSGAQKLLPKGLERVDNSEDNKINPTLLKQVISSSRLIYALIAAIVFIVISTLGSYYISTIIEQKGIEDTAEIWISWVVVVLNTSINFYYLYLNAFLQGRGYVRQSQKAIIISNIVMMSLAMIGLNFGYGIIALVSASFISVVANRFISKRYFYDKELAEILSESDQITFEDKKNIIKVLWYNAKRFGIVGIGGFLINKAGQLLVTSFFTLSLAAQYGLTMQFVTVISGLAGSYITLMYPRITHDYYKNNIVAVRKHFGIIVLIVLLAYLFGCVGLLTVGNIFLELIGTQTQLLPTWQVIFLFFLHFLETQHSALANIHSIGNSAPFVKPSIYSGVAIVSLTYLLLEFTTPNIWIVLLVQFVVQASYNNWKWPYDACKILDISYWGFYRLGLKAMNGQIKSIIVK